MHPKTEIRPHANSISRILAAGWVGQVKIHGHRAQVHFHADPQEECIVYNRQGGIHKKKMSANMALELRRIFLPQSGWSIIDAEWIKDKDKLYVFDFLQKDGTLLTDLTYLQRYQLLPREYLSPHVQTLSLLTTVEKCLEVMNSSRKEVEGLVFKSLHTPGLSDTSIIRCRREWPALSK